MTKEELEKEAEEYADWFWGASPSMMKALARAYIKGAEPREKRIAELEAQIKKMQDDIDCLTFACENYREEMEKNLADATELEKENAELKCECRRCVYSDSPCILSDYGKDRNGICDHFKDVFEELTLTNNECKDMREELKQRIRENQKHYEYVSSQPKE